ncbi:hypothetical protein PsYK624_086890 [Phanerochaete sordida]|uniref:Geranylgeranyl pyrophosphate synthetase n=1 Tax=Phanerochaete sordida TaxID=48140 RepID=A0A9P3GEZ1_9APHY|nr:hypothetical protein PsYK624_086890 [Phanerochaete sordida]
MSSETSWRARPPSSTSPANERTSLSDGPFRGRYYYRGRGAPTRGRPSVPRIPGKNILQGLYPSTIQAIEKPSDVPGSDDIVIDDVQYVGSYSWTESQEPTILVPGSPRLWRTDLTFPFSVPPDKGITFVYQNGHRCPESPLLPLFIAADTLARDGCTPVEWTTVDIVTDRNNLRKLWAFVEIPEPSDFRIDLELAGPWTLLMQRWEERTAETNGEHSRAGFGDEFEKRCTSAAPECERGVFAGHHRVISYDMSGLRLIVRCEVDAYLSTADDVTGDKHEEPSDQPETSKPEDALASALESLSLSSTSTSSHSTPTPVPQPSQVHGLTVIKAGSIIPQSSLTKVKSRSQQSMAALRWYEVYPQLLLGQTMHCMMGVHSRGTFAEVRHFEIDAPELEDVARSVQPGLRKLRALLEEIQQAAMACGAAAKLSLVCRERRLVLLRRTSAASLLPPDILRRFDA